MHLLGAAVYYSISPLLNSKRVAKASLLCREVWYAFRCESHRMLNPDCAVTAKMFSCRAQNLHCKSIDGNSEAMDGMCLFLRRLNYSSFTLGKSFSIA